MDYGFTHNDTVYTPNGTMGISVAENADRNRQIEAAELENWNRQPDVQIAYFHFPESSQEVERMCTNRAAAVGRRFTFYPSLRGATVTTWPGTVLGTIIAAHVYRHNFGGRFVSLRVRGTNGAVYAGRASWDWGQVIRLRKVRS